MLTGRHLWGHDIRRRHVVLAALAVGLALLVLALSTLPDAGLRWGLVRALRGLGMVEISVSDTDLSLFDGNVVVRRVVARPSLSGVPLGIKDFSLNFRWTPLLSKRVVIDKVALEGVEIHIRRTEAGGFIIDGLPVAVTEPPPPVAAEGSPSTPWGIDLTSLELTDSRLELTDRNVTVSVAVSRLLIGNLRSRDPDQPMTVVLDGTVNDSVIHLNGWLRPFAEQPNFSLEMTAEGLDPSSLSRLAEQSGIGGLEAQGRLSLGINGSLGAPGLSLAATGHVELDRLAMTHPVELSASHLVLDLGESHWATNYLGLAPRLDSGALSLKMGGASVQMEALSLAIPRLVWNGQKLELAGKVEAKAVQAAQDGRSLAVAALALESRDLTWDGRLAWNGGLRLSNAKAAAPEGEAASDLLAWSGTLSLVPGGGQPKGSAEGKLDLGGVSAKALDFVLGLKHVAAETRLDFGKAGAPAVTGRIRPVLDGVSVRQPDKGLNWLALEHFDGGEVRLDDSGAIGSDRVTLTGLSALRQEGARAYPWRLEVRSARLDHPLRDEDGDLEASALRLDGVTARITRTADGFLGLPPPSLVPPEPPGKKPPPAKEAEAGPAFALGRLDMGGDSRVQFRDRSMGEAVRVDVQGIEASIAGLDTDQPEQDSAFDVKATVGQASIALGGTVRPLAPKLSGTLNGRIQSLELVPLSPYLAEALGVNLQTGQFSGNFKGGAAKGALDGRLEVDLANLFIAQADPNAPVTKKMDMPVETVLNLLRDGEDRIRLALPIRGALDKPDLDISDAVAQAVAGALKSTMMTTLRVAFPLVGLIELAVDASDPNQLSLAPLSFDPGEAVLSSRHQTTLSEVGRLLVGRPGLRLTLCGKATGADWPVLAQRRRDRDKPILSRLEKLVGVERKTEELGPLDPNAMSRLADARAGAVKQYLVDRAGVDAGRVFACRAQVNADDSGEPRVELLL